MDEKKTVIEVKNVRKVYRMGKEKIVAVKDISFDIKEGEFCCLLGTSGSGKSTLLNLMAGIEKLTSGTINIKGSSIGQMSEKDLAHFRQKYLGFVFQSYNLLNNLTARENVEFPMIFQRVPQKERTKRATAMLKKVGLGNRMVHKPKEMSGGQQQRVGIARAFVGKPQIIFADEPTGNLDTKTSFEVMELIKQMAIENNQTIVMVTHDIELAVFADRIIRIRDGLLESVEINEHPATTVAEANPELAAEIESQSEELAAETESRNEDGDKTPPVTEEKENETDKSDEVENNEENNQ